MKRFSALFLAAMLLLGGCGGKKTPDETVPTQLQSPTDTQTTTTPVTLTVWGPQEDQTGDNAWLPAMCEAFRQENPQWDITFRYGVCSEGDAGTVVSADPTDAADVYFFANDQIGTLRASGAISRLGGEALTDVENSNAANIVAAVTAEDGGVYGIPVTGNTWFLYYNKSIFTQEDVKSLDAMLEKGKVAFPMTDSWYLASFYAAAGATFFGDDGIDPEAGIDLGPDAVAATEALIRLAQHPNFVNDAEGAGVSGLLDGTIGAIFSGTWDAAKIRETLGENYGAAVLPTVTIGGQQRQLLSFAGCKAVAVNPNCKNLRAAVALARFLGGARAQQAHYEMRGIVPCHLSLVTETSFSHDPAALAQDNTLLKTSIVQPSLAEMGDFWTPGDNMGSAIIAGSVNLENAKAETAKFQAALNNGQ